MTSFEWFLLIVVVIVVPLIVAGVVTLWTIDQANKRKRANRKDPQIGVKRKAALSLEEVAAHNAARAAAAARAETDDLSPPPASTDTAASNSVSASASTSTSTQENLQASEPD